MVSLKRIEAFVTVAEQLSFTAASKKLNVAQPWLSQQVRLLEDDLGAALFTRNNRKVELTAHGKEYLSISRDMISKFREMIALRNKIRWQSENRLRLGSESNISHSARRNLLVVEAVQKMPGTKLQIIEDNPAILFQMLENDELDIVITHLPEPDIDVDYVTISRHEMLVLVPRETKLAKENCITFEDMRGMRILASPIIYHTTRSPRLRSLFDPYAIEWVPAPTNHLEDRILVAQARRLATLLVGYAESLAIPDDMVLCHIEGPPLVHELVVMKKRGQRSKAIDRFWSLAQAIHDDEKPPF